MTAQRQKRGQAARQSGRRGEWLAAGFLLLKGYRIIGFRLATPQGEIDLLAVKGPILAVVEVKQRSALDDALEAVTPRQRERLIRAATQIAQRRPSLANTRVRLDLIALAPRRWPVHIRGAWTDH